MDKPEIDFPDFPAPTDLVIEDLLVGEGKEAVSGGRVTVHYVGVAYSTGEEFDSSWSRGETITFGLAQVIAGWQMGIPGMKVGGRRKLIIPPHLGYGDRGAGAAIKPGETLIFVVDLVDA
jgi:peptidylprolyl isomerase